MCFMGNELECLSMFFFSFLKLVPSCIILVKYDHLPLIPQSILNYTKGAGEEERAGVIFKG